MRMNLCAYVFTCVFSMSVGKRARIRISASAFVLVRVSVFHAFRRQCVGEGACLFVRIHARVCAFIRLRVRVQAYVYACVGLRASQWLGGCNITGVHQKTQPCVSHRKIN